MPELILMSSFKPAKTRILDEFSSHELWDELLVRLRESNAAEFIYPAQVEAMKVALAKPDLNWSEGVK